MLFLMGVRKIKDFYQNFEPFKAYFSIMDHLGPKLQLTLVDFACSPGLISNISKF